MGVLESIYRDFTARLPTNRCPYAVHRLAVYEAYMGGGYRFLAFVADPSRHAAAYKLVGLFSKLLAERGVEGVPIVVSTGRISADMVQAFSSAGIGVVVSFHHPVLSGLLEAEKRGVTLVLRDTAKPVFKPYTAAWRIEV